jgi:hypothetical protein
MTDIANDRAGRIVDDLRIMMRGNTDRDPLKPSTADWLERQIAEAIREAMQCGNCHPAPTEEPSI